MPKCSITTIVESNMACGIIRKFNNDNQSRTWERLHYKKCEKCRNLPMTESIMTELQTNYDSVSGYMNAQQNVATQRDILFNQVF